MKIVKKRSQKEKYSRVIWLVVALLLLALVLIINHSRTGTSLSEQWRDLRNSLPTGNAATDLPVMAIDMAFPEYDQILGQREEALSSGVALLGDQDFVPADINFDDMTVPVRMRLRQGPVVHLGEGEKWNLEVRTRNNQLVDGMQRFYLIDPADNNWLNEYAFAEALKSEGLMAGRYDFVRLFLNGDYQGVYALQEGFGPELIAANEQPSGVIVEFDANPLWEAMAFYGGDFQEVVNDPITNLGSEDFRFFEVDTFRDADIADDPQLSAQKERAIGLLRGLQNGDLPASEVFDLEKYGRFLALADLWAATEATSLTNLRYYFNPETSLLEPIGFNANPFGAADRLSMNATFDDPALQSAYLVAAQRMAQPAYLDELSGNLPDKVDTLQQVLASESGQELPWEQLSQRQENIKRSLYPLQPVFAYLGPPTLAQEGIIQIDIANVVNLPLEIIGFDLDGATFLEVDPAWIQNGVDHLVKNEQGKIILPAQSSAHAPALRTIRFHLPLTEIIERDEELDFLHDMDLQVATRIVGLDDIHMTSARPGYADPLVEPNQPGSDQ